MKRRTGFLIILIVLIVASLGAAQLRGIREIDFKNFTYVWDDAWEDAPPEQWHWVTTRPKAKVSVSNGRHRFDDEALDSDDPSRAPVVSVDSVTYGDLTGDGKEEAVVSLNYSTGGTANWDYVYIFRLKEGAPFLMARMQTGSRAYGGLVGVSIQKGLLALDFADKDRMVGDCCSEGFVRVRYQWQGNHFVEVGNHDRGDMDLHTGRP
jgi:hypothetical protein